MSSSYPILGNKRIDQWKVTELKEELKRRKLTIKGLKEDLVKRLDEALRIEREEAEASEREEAEASEREEAEASEKEEVNGSEGDAAGLSNSHKETVVVEVADTIVRRTIETVETTDKGDTTVVESVQTENAEQISEVVDNDSKKSDKLDGVTIPVDINSSVSAVDEVKHADVPVGEDFANVAEGLLIHASTTETTDAVSQSALAEDVIIGQESCNEEPQNDHGQEPVTKKENEESKVCLDNESKPQLECDLKPPCDDLKPNSSLPENQVSEVNPSLGPQVKSESISSYSMSINEKNELKDTIIADNVKLEQDVVRPELVKEPSSRNDVPVCDESHSMDVGELHEKKACVEENSCNNKSPDLNNINSNEDVGYPEKLNLDRSSGDDSMEEDLPESKQFDSKINVDELRDNGENVEVSIVKEEGSTAVVGDGLSSEKRGTHHDDDILPVSVEKRKFHDQAPVGNNEPAKRQRRWNSETVKGSDLLSPTLKTASTPKEEPITLKPNFSRSDSLAVDDEPKERIVPPSQKSPTNSLKIDRFLRPFTLRAVQELLGKTGNVTDFWMDQIKTHCYVTYSSVEEAIETRNAVYNLQWPPNGGRLLVAEYVDPQEVKIKIEAPTQVASVSNNTVAPTTEPEPSPLQLREQPAGPIPATLTPPPPPQSKPPLARERLPSPPPIPKKVDQPIVTLDDLFRKTRATPRIYYLPLSDEQVALKLQHRAEASSSR